MDFTWSLGSDSHQPIYSFLGLYQEKIYKIIDSKAFWTQDIMMYKTIFTELLTLAINAWVSPFTS